MNVQPSGTDYPHIVFDENGVPAITGTRIKVANVAIERIEAGRTAEQIARTYPAITLAQVHSALAYYYDHRDEIDRYIAERDELAERLRPELEDAAFLTRLARLHAQRSRRRA